MTASNEPSQDLKTDGERVAKAIARSGLCSRREAEALIADRRVSVNGTIIESAALDILVSDAVLVDGRPLSVREPPRLWRYYKPRGRVTTHKDPEGRPTVFEAFPEDLPRLISVGRLDFNTEGLLLLTNDGDLARHLELPSTGWTRRYRVRAYGRVSEAQLKELAGGLAVDKMHFGPIEASLERAQGDNVWIAISIREGKNREVRRIMEHLHLEVNRLIRVSFGPFMLGELEPGQIEEVKTAVLKDQLGPRLSRQLGVKREPMREERRLAPARGKPTYLRRKPGPARPPERLEPERTLKRRRILPIDGSEAPKVEFVAERKPWMERGGKAGGHDAKPRFGVRGRENESGRDGEASRSGKSPRGKPFEPRARSSGDRAESSPDRPPRRTHGAGAERPAWKPRERPDFVAKKDAASGDAPRFDKYRGERPRSSAPLDDGGERPAHRNSSRSTEDRRDGRSRPPRRLEKAGGGAPLYRAPGESSEYRGERPRAPARLEGGGGRQAHRSGPRSTGDRPGERPRPPRGFDKAGGGAPSSRAPREERSGETARPSSHSAPKGERKPYQTSGGGDRAAGARGDDRPRKSGGGKNFRASGKPAHARHGPGPRKPGPKARPGFDKDRP